MTRIQMRPLREYAIGIYDGPHATPKESSDGAIFLGIKNITSDGKLDLSDIRFVSEQEFPRWTRRVTPKNGDIVLTYEATLHRYAIIPDGFRGCLGRRVALVRPNPSKANSRYLLYYFLSHQWRKTVESYVITGATVDRIPIEKLPDFPAALPDLEAQTRVASILSAYDDLIANNRRQIQLLEDAARLLYREWFVRLRFPGHEHAKIRDGVPEGWKRGPLGQLCVEVREICQPASLEPDAPYIGLEHMPRRSIALSEWGTTEQVTSSKHRFRENDILFGKIRPYFHKVGIALTEGIASSDAIVIRPASQELLPLVLMVTSSDAFVADTAQKMKEGSKMPRADWKQMTQYPVLYPSDNTLWALNDFIEPILQQIKTLVFSNRNLAVARDLLLPKLMSGEVAV